MHKFLLLLGILFLVGCSGGEQVSPADKAVVKESLPAPSSLIEDEETKLTITAHELVKGISGNNIKQNIEQYFGKYAEITGVVKRIDKKVNSVDVTLDGEVDGTLSGVTCRINLSTVDNVKVGEIETIYGQIKALKEVPGNQVQDQLMIQSYAQLVRPCSMMPR
jgi:hypothetical protein|tara:strand:+ start:157 stop:648 length:492 start_codon:yes stop_codon:yes gene_type:complete